jgi:hypothetical protein
LGGACPDQVAGYTYQVSHALNLSGRGFFVGDVFGNITSENNGGHYA